MKVGIDNYCLYPLGMLPLELIRWAHDKGAEGVSFSGFGEEARQHFTSSYLRDVRQLAYDLQMYLEWGNGQHVPMDLNTYKPKDICIENRRAIGEAYGLGVNIIRSCSGGLMRWKKDSPSTDALLKETARELRKEASMFRDNGIILAIETHFEFTTFELLRLFDMCDTDPGDYLGICLDTMNLLTMLEDPLTATKRILPWIVSTHIKDGGIFRNSDTITTFPAPLGRGIIDIAGIIQTIRETCKPVNLSVECHGGDFNLPVNECWFAERFPDLIENEKRILDDLAEQTESKMKSKVLSLTDRSEWPLVCAERTANDLKELIRLRDRLS